MCNASVNVLGVAVVFEVFMVCINRDGGWGANQKMSPMVETSHEGEKFTVMDVIVMFGIRKGLGVEPYSGMFALMILLCEYGSHGEGGGVDLKEERFRGVRLE